MTRLHDRPCSVPFPAAAMSSDNRVDDDLRLQDVQVHTEVSVFDPDIEGQQIRLVYTQAKSAIIAAFVLALLVAAGLWQVVDTSLMTLWLAAQAVQTILRIGLVYRYDKAGKTNRQRPFWMLAFFAGALVSGIIWGCLGLLFSFSWPVEYQTLTLLCLAGVVAGAISSYAAVLSVYIAFMVPCILIPAQSMLVYTTSLQPNLGLIMMLFAGVLVAIARNYNHHVVRTLQLGMENDSLVTSMQSANGMLEAEIEQRAMIQRSLLAEQQLFTRGPVTVFRWSLADGWPIEYVSETISQLGYRASELIDGCVSYRDMVCKGDHDRVAGAWEKTASGETNSRGIDYRIRAADGRVRWVYEFSVPVRDDDGVTTHLYGYILDITERKNSEYELQQEKDRAQITLHSIAEAVITTDVNGQIEYLNPRAVEWTGWECHIARGLPVSRIFSLFEEGGHGEIEVPVIECLRTGEIQQSGSDLTLQRNDGEQFTVRYSISPIMSSADSPIGVIMVFHDVTEARELEKHISYQASHDALTGLLNRTAFEARLAHVVKYAGRTDESHILCLVDIDQLKIINDTGSHEAGDELLKKVSVLLHGCLRESDEIARLGGDEFGILLKNCTLHGATSLAGKMLGAISDLRFSCNERVFDISASIGLSQLDSYSNSVTHIMSEADIACQAAKDLGGNRFHIYQSTDEELMRRQAEMHWVARISDAIQANRFVLYCQDIAPTVPADDAPLHFEVLVRMLDEEGGIISPDRFLPAAERYNLVTAIDRWVVTNSFAWYAANCDLPGGACLDTMAINLSGMSLTDRSFLMHIRNGMSKYGVPPGAVCFEITETAAISNLSAASGFINDLKSIGCRFALDDFGSGLSSFAYLKNLPVDYLKIDGQFVRDMDTDPVNFAMVSAIQQLGSVIGIKTVAEFVETEATQKLLAELGVDFVQGYGIAEPVPLEGLDTSRRETA